MGLPVGHVFRGFSSSWIALRDCRLPRSHAKRERAARRLVFLRLWTRSMQGRSVDHVRARCAANGAAKPGRKRCDGLYVDDTAKRLSKCDRQGVCGPRRLWPCCKLPGPRRCQVPSVTTGPEDHAPRLLGVETGLHLSPAYKNSRFQLVKSISCGTVDSPRYFSCVHISLASCSGPAK